MKYIKEYNNFEDEWEELEDEEIDSDIDFYYNYTHNGEDNLIKQLNHKIYIFFKKDDFCIVIIGFFEDVQELICWLLEAKASGHICFNDINFLLGTGKPGSIPRSFLTPTKISRSLDCGTP